MMRIYLIHKYYETEGFYETDPFEVQIYTDPEGNLYLWEDTEVYEFWFLKEDEEY